MKKKKKDSNIGVVIAGASSSSGKTLFTLGLMEALKRKGIAVQPFKAGPDYIDPGWHRAVTGASSYNLDTWMMGSAQVKKTFRAKAAGRFPVIEGVMGLYDGKDGVNEEGSTAHLSKLLKLPVLLVINAAKAARSIGAVVKGFESYDAKVDIRWVVFNMVGSPRHFQILKDSIPKGSKIKVIGYIPKDEGLKMPERHLGLVEAKDIKKSGVSGVIGRAADIIEDKIDIKELLKGANDARPVLRKQKRALKKTARIAVARDSAFSFYYEENLEILESFGAVLVPFSPLKDKRLPKGVNGIYLGGGYPEIYAERLQANSSIRSAIKAASKKGLPIYAECGGLMYLGKAIKDRQGKRYEMAGVFPWTSRMLEKRKALGYREVALNGSSPIAPNEKIRGHEFHYSEIKEPPPSIKRVFTVEGRSSEEGFVSNNTLATYIHLHFASNTALARGFVALCAKAVPLL